jgi:hypothetical protein
MATLAQIAVGATSTGGIATLIVSSLRGKNNKKDDTDKNKESSQ